MISANKSDSLEYYGADFSAAKICHAVQPKPTGLCDAIFRAVPFIERHESVVVGLPDTIWFLENGLTTLPDEGLSFLLFPVFHPEPFDYGVLDKSGGFKDSGQKRNSGN